MRLFIRVSTISALIFLGARVLSSQSVIDAAQTAKIESIDYRVGKIEEVHPDAISERLKNLEERVNDQQKLLWGILAAVIVNLLTGGSKVPFSAKRRRESEV